jgi:hypothetical protein
VIRAELYPPAARIEWEVDRDVSPDRRGHALRNLGGTYHCQACGSALATFRLTYAYTWTDEAGPSGESARAFGEHAIGSETSGIKGLVNRGARHRSGLAWYHVRSITTVGTCPALRLPVVATCAFGHDNLLDARHE